MIYDVAIIGGGPAGYTAASKAAGYGLQVILFEKKFLGGTCLNCGCIPTKALIHATETYADMKKADSLGISFSEVSYDFVKMHQRKNEVVEKLRQGVAGLMKAGKVTVVEGFAKIEAEGTISCNEEIYQAKDIVVASGSKVSIPPIAGSDLDGVLTSDDILLDNGCDCESLIIIGGGVIGVECASIYLGLGKKVIILEAEKQILPMMDKEIAQRLTMLLKKQGGTIETSAKVQSIEKGEQEMVVAYTNKKGAQQTVTAQKVLIATGRKPNCDGLFSENYQPEMFRGGIVGDEAGRTSLEHLYVIGDAKAHNIQLAHLAEAQGKNVAAVIAGKEAVIDTSLVPSCVYTSPEVAAVGLSEEQAKDKGIKVISKKYLTGANGKCVIEDAEAGFVKLVVEEETKVILGASLYCPRATDLVSELALAIQKKMTTEQLGEVIHPHPTFSEMIQEAVHSF